MVSKIINYTRFLVRMIFKNEIIDESIYIYIYLLLSIM